MDFRFLVEWRVLMGEHRKPGHNFADEIESRIRKAQHIATAFHAVD